MSYTVLARKWRPKNFSELVGQSHVMQALSNALDQQRLHHAYLFTGTRGVGKTTIARIFAKALNCQEGVGSQPCGVCETCRSIDEGRFIDLIEVDAASKTKVDDTREILDNVQFAPTQGRYKVYLIDEVHMLSKSSFNALLKTLEEPPEHVKFLLATTDPHKLPITVLSRCLQFNLMRLTQPQLQNHLASILTQEQITFEDSALALIAKSADGSARDSLSLLDQAIAYGAGQVMFEAVQTMLGLVDQQFGVAILQALANDDTQALKEIIQNLAVMGVDYQALLSQLIESLHAIAYAQLFQDQETTTLLPAEVVKGFAQSFAPERVQMLYQIALLAKQDMQLAPDVRIGFEMSLMRMLAFVPSELASQDNGKQSAPNQGAATEAFTASALAADTAPINGATLGEMSPTDAMASLASARSLVGKKNTEISQTPELATQQNKQQTPQQAAQQSPVLDQAQGKAQDQASDQRQVYQPVAESVAAPVQAAEPVKRQIPNSAPAQNEQTSSDTDITPVGSGFNAPKKRTLEDYPSQNPEQANRQNHATEGNEQAVEQENHQVTEDPASYNPDNQGLFDSVEPAQVLAETVESVQPPQSVEPVEPVNTAKPEQQSKPKVVDHLAMIKAKLSQPFALKKSPQTEAKTETLQTEQIHSQQGHSQESHKEQAVSQPQQQPPFEEQAIVASDVPSNVASDVASKATNNIIAEQMAKLADMPEQTPQISEYQTSSQPSMSNSGHQSNDVELGDMPPWLMDDYSNAQPAEGVAPNAVSDFSEPPLEAVPAVESEAIAVQAPLETPKTPGTMSLQQVKQGLADTLTGSNQEETAGLTVASAATNEFDASQTAVASVEQQNPPAPSFNPSGNLLEDWKQMITTIGLKGMAEDIARNCVLVEYTQDYVAVSLDPAQQFAKPEMALEQISTALKNYFNDTIELKMVESAEHFTPIKEAQLNQQNRLQAAQESIANDPVIQQLKNALAMEVIASSVKPV